MLPSSRLTSSITPRIEHYHGGLQVTGIRTATYRDHTPNSADPNTTINRDKIMSRNSLPPQDRYPRRSDGVNRRQVLLAATGLAASLAPVAAAQAEERWYDTIFQPQTDGASSTTQKPKVLRLDDSDLNTSSVPLVSKEMLKRFDEAIEHYTKLVDQGDWPKLKRGRYLRTGSRHRTIGLVRKQLAITGDLDSHSSSWSPDSDYFDDNFANALKTFQHRHGLRVSGRLDRSTRHQLSFSAKERLKQLKGNRRRIARLLKISSSDRYILVNVPGYQLEAITQGEVDRRHTVIVGRRDRQTPELSATIRGVNFFPFWRVPYSIAKKDLIPRARRDAAFIEEQNFRVSSGSFGGQRLDPEDINWKRASADTLKFRQDPGPWNALGLVRVNMPNKDIIYLHDTPLKRLFKQRHRAFSAGCIRVHDIMALVAWLGRGNDDLSRKAIDELIEETDPADQSERRDKHLDFRLKRSVPVHLAYLTAWVEDDGRVIFRNDIYNRDGNRSRRRARIAKVTGTQDLSP